MMPAKRPDSAPNTYSRLTIRGVRPVKMAMRRLACCSVALLLLASCGEPIPKENTGEVTRSTSPRILTIGDSLLAVNRNSRQSISNSLEMQLSQPVVDRSVIGARFNYALPISGAMGLNIAKQYREGQWDWVVINGGGNDLWFGCGCVACDGTIDKMISAEGTTGKIPELVSRIRSGGARVIFLGYFHSPGVFSIIDHCKDEDIKFEKRISNFANAHSGVYYLPLKNLVPYGDRSFQAADMIHPSIKGSRIIGELIAKTIREAR